MVDFNSLSSNQRFALNLLVPFLYLLPLIVAWFSPKNFGFGYSQLVGPSLAVGMMGLSVVDISDVAFGEIPGGASGCRVTSGAWGVSLYSPSYLFWHHVNSFGTAVCLRVGFWDGVFFCGGDSAELVSRPAGGEGSGVKSLAIIICNTGIKPGFDGNCYDAANENSLSRPDDHDR